MATGVCSCLKLFSYSIVILVAGVIVVSYYAVIVITYGPRLLNHFSFLPFFIITLFHILLVLLTWSYFMVVFGDPGSVPENWKPELENTDMRLSGFVTPNETTETTPVVPYCTHCRNGKPPRCHHCSVCQRCVLKMDHHCIWVVNCVGARNYKFFLLFVVYTFLETTMDTFVLLPSFIEFFQEAKHRSISAGHLALTLLAFVLNLAFASSLLCFVVMHASLVSSNTTSIEVYEKKGVTRWKYDLGRRKNFEQVFGTKKALWFFPLFSKEDMEKIPALDGLHFPTHSDVEV